jgi:hypothetical protein
MVEVGRRGQREPRAVDCDRAPDVVLPRRRCPVRDTQEDEGAGGDVPHGLRGFRARGWFASLPLLRLELVPHRLLEATEDVFPALDDRVLA